MDADMGESSVAQQDRKAIGYGIDTRPNGKQTTALPGFRFPGAISTGLSIAMAPWASLHRDEPLA
jgi:hypothetical protein